MADRDEHFLRPGGNAGKPDGDVLGRPERELPLVVAEVGAPRGERDQEARGERKADKSGARPGDSGHDGR